MPKNIWHELRCGAMYKFKEYRFEDLAPIEFIEENIPAEERAKVHNPINTGRRRVDTLTAFNTKIVNKFWEIAVNEMMESNTIKIDKYTKMYIGLSGARDDGRIVRWRKRKLAYLHTKAIYGIVLNGFFHEYNFRMPFRRRKELFERLKNGQTFIT